MCKSWEELIEELWEYLSNLSDEQRKNLETDMNIKEHQTSFGTIKYIEPKLFKEEN